MIVVQSINNNPIMYYTLKHALNFDSLNVCAFLGCSCNIEALRGIMPKLA